MLDTALIELYVPIWLVVYLPLWKIWLRQLEWWHSQYMESHNPFHGSKPPTSMYIYIYSVYSYKYLVSIK